MGIDAKPTEAHRVVRAVERCAKRLAGGVLVAVSGGADSVALLAACRAAGLAPLAVGHVNHGLRGAESDADAAFVQGLADQWSLPAHVERAEVSPGRNVEATARRARYECLAQVAQALGLRSIVTAHTADDQAETVLLRLLRGTGVAGLAGIPPARRLGGLLVVRPFLRLRRADVRHYLDQVGQTYRHDRSNADRRFTRNRVRHELMPLLARDYNPRLVDHLGRLGRLAAEAEREAAERVRRLLAEAELPPAGALRVFESARLRRADRGVLRRFWRAVWRREGWPAGEMRFAHWDRLAALASTESATIDLPGGVRARRLARVVRVGPGA
jgi:tRNA(Ile)-lysidine synthase